jgi:nicotinamidase-related amidase
MTMNPYAECLKPEDCVLLLVDIQKVLLDPCAETQDLVKNTATLMDIAGIFRIPTLFSVQNAQKLGGVIPELAARVPEPTVFNKLEFSCMENEGIVRALEATRRRTLLVAGIEAHVCVFQTSVRALQAGYRVHVAADAVASRSAFNRKAGLKRMEGAGVVLSSTEMIVFELLNRAGTPEFRSALPLLKIL